MHNLFELTGDNFWPFQVDFIALLRKIIFSMNEDSVNLFSLEKSTAKHSVFYHLQSFFLIFEFTKGFFTQVLLYKIVSNARRSLFTILKEVKVKLK